MMQRLCVLFAVLFFHQYGSTQLAQEPYENPTSISFSNLNSFTFKVNYNQVKTSHFYLVLMQMKTTIIDKPVDGVSYQRGDKIGFSKVVYIGSDTCFTPSAIRANSTYFITVFSFNGAAGTENYQQLGNKIQKVITTGSKIGSYYEGISKTAPNFISLLSERINKHLVLPYSDYKTTVLSSLELIDTSHTQRYVECAYSGEKKLFSDAFDWTALGYSREHAYPHSWMPSYPANNPPKAEYSDFHNLYPCNLDKANAPRSNFPLGEVTGDVVFSYLEGKLGYNGKQLVFEPRSKHKGNAARAMMYMAISYSSAMPGWELPQQQDQEILKKWHFQDPPDNYELARNEYIYSIQGNRNPFIDSVTYACYIDFNTLKNRTKGCLNLAVSQSAQKEKLPILINQTLINEGESPLMISIINEMGQVVLESTSLESKVKMDVSMLQKGWCFVNIEAPFKEIIRFFIE